MYRCVAQSIEGFVQQLAVAYVSNGYWFYVTGRVPAQKDPAAVDRKLIERYGVDMSKWARARRKAAGMANVHYLRHERFWVLIASKGQHPFFAGEPGFRDIREQPLSFGGYSIGYKRGGDGKWHASIRLHPDRYRELRGYFIGLAAHRSVENLWREFQALAVMPYAPVRRQLLNIWRAVNHERHGAGFEPLPVGVLALRPRPVKTFGSVAATSPTNPGSILSMRRMMYEPR